MPEHPFEVAVGDGVLRGHRGGEGPPALLLHGGAAIPDYMDGCAEELDGLFHTIRYTQRGPLPSTDGPPYSIESHMASRTPNGYAASFASIRSVPSATSSMTSARRSDAC